MHLDIAKMSKMQQNPLELAKQHEPDLNTPKV